MNPARLSVEDLLPHRDRMRLVDEIVEVDIKKAVTRSRVNAQWPLFDGRAVHALVLIELVAQTAGINNSWGGKIKHGEDYVARGWLVGIKDARFYIDAVPLDTCLTTRSVNQFELEGYRVVQGTVDMDGKRVAEVELQLIQSNGD